MSQNDYKWVSVKQRNIIDSAIRELDVAIRAKENQEKMRERVENTIRSSGNKSGAIDIDNMSADDVKELKDMNNSSTSTDGETPNMFDVATMLGDGLIGQL